MANEESHRVQSREAVRRQKCGREEFQFKSRNPILVVLDGVSRAHNIGAIFRLCDSMLIERLVICGVEVDLRKRKLVQQRWVPWSEAMSAHDAVTQAKADGYQVVIAESAHSRVPRLRRL